MALDSADLSDEVLAFLGEYHLATLTTLRADGSPHVVAVGFSYDVEARVARVITWAGAQKARNVERMQAAGQRAAVCQVDGGRWLSLEGPVRLVVDPTLRRRVRVHAPLARALQARVEIRLAPVAPVEPTLLATAASRLDRIGAARAALPGTSVDHEHRLPTGLADRALGPEVGPQHRRCTVRQADRVVFGERADLRERAEPDAPQNLAPEHVAETVHHPLIEQHLGHPRLGVGVGEQQVDDLAEIGVVAAEIGAQTPHPGMTALVGASVGLDDGGAEAHRCPVGDLDRCTHLAERAPPSVGTAVDVPGPVHAQRRVEDEPVVPFDLEVPSTPLGMLDDAPRLGGRPDEHWGIEPQHLPAGERCSQSTRRPKNRIAIGHRTVSLRAARQPGPGWSALAVAWRRHVR